VLLIALAPASAQQTEVRDTTLDAEPIATLAEINRGPRRALLWSIIPGGGQVYNRSWWKVPLVYGGLLGVVAVADYNQTQYNRVVRALEARCLGDGLVVVIPNRECIPKESEFSVAQVATSTLVNSRNSFNRQRQTAYFGIIAAYILQAVEAFTDAHLRDFDIDDDLSIRLTPITQPGVVGGGLTVPLGSGRQARRQEAEVARLSR
jgi:hypothetical protein